jgi:error-prone DNA polymerase
MRLPLRIITLSLVLFGHTQPRVSLGVRVIPGCQLDLLDGPSLIALPTNIEAYARISALLTLGNLRTEKGSCILYKADVFQHAEGTRFILIPPTSLNEVFDF